VEAVKADAGLYTTLADATLAKLGEHASEVAPISDPDTPIEDSPIGEFTFAAGQEEVFDE
jgi:hypothetical protein